MSNKQLSALYDTSKRDTGQYISNMLDDSELDTDSVVNNYFTTASADKRYEVIFYPNPSTGSARLPDS